MTVIQRAELSNLGVIHCMVYVRQNDTDTPFLGRTKERALSYSSQPNRADAVFVQAAEHDSIDITN